MSAASDGTGPRAAGVSLAASAGLLYIACGIVIVMDVAAFLQFAPGSQGWNHALWQLPLNLVILGFALLVGRGKRWALVAALVVWCADAVVGWIIWRGVFALVLSIIVAWLIARPLFATSNGRA
jgi:hypothetical protein